MWLWRKMLKISWKEHITNEEVLMMVDEKRAMISTIRQRQWNWIGHVLRGDSLLKVVIDGRMKGKKTRGRMRMKLLDWTMTGDQKKSYSMLRKETERREE